MALFKGLGNWLQTATSFETKLLIEYAVRVVVGGFNSEAL